LLIEKGGAETALTPAPRLHEVQDFKLSDGHRPAEAVGVGLELLELAPQHQRRLLIDVIGIRSIAQHGEQIGEQPVLMPGE
jgi:hypothetical protein